MSVAFDSDVDVLVEIAFDSDPFAESPSFTDISQFVRSFNTSRGRINELGQFGSGSCTLILSNADNRFNPTNVSSPYYDSTEGKTKIQPLKRLRISATYDSITYRVFEGFLDKIPVSYPANGNDSVVTLQASDAFRLFRQGDIASRGFRLGLPGFSEVGQSTRLSFTPSGNELSSTRPTNGET